MFGRFATSGERRPGGLRISTRQRRGDGFSLTQRLHTGCTRRECNVSFAPRLPGIFESRQGSVLVLVGAASRIRGAQPDRLAIDHNFHAAVALAAFRSIVRRDGLQFSEASRGDRGDGHALLC